MKKIIVFQNKKKQGSAAVLDTILPVLKRGYECLITDNSQDARALMQSGAEIAVCLGGDGTMLAVAEDAAANGVALLGVNLGHLGYMSELETDESRLLEKLVSGDYAVEERFMLHAELIRGDGVKECYEALNEILVCRGAISKMIGLRLRCDGEDVAAYRADGLIASTPTGSTAYSLSAGGPIIDPKLSLISVCPICPHAFAGSRPMVFSPGSELEIAVSSSYNGDIYLTADGRSSREVGYDDVIRVTGSKLKARFIKLKKNAFYKTLYRKFNAGETL